MPSSTMINEGNYAHVPGFLLVRAVGRLDERIRGVLLLGLNAARVAARQTLLAHAHVLNGAEEARATRAFGALLLFLKLAQVSCRQTP